MKQSVVVAVLAVLAAAMSADAAFAAGMMSRKTHPDWPCEQLLVSHLSPASMWTGPSIAGLDKSPDPKIDALATRLAERRLPLAKAKAQIDAFAKAAGPNRKHKLAVLFALLFDKMDSERSLVIGGLMRFGHRQIEMAKRIRAENAKLHEEQDKSTSPEEVKSTDKLSKAAQKLKWDVRIFEEQHKTLHYVCQVPVIIEQRLFGLAREIQNNMS